MKAIENTMVIESLEGRFLAKKVFLSADYKFDWLIKKVLVKFIIKCERANLNNSRLLVDF